MLLSMEKKIFDQPINSELKTYENVRNTATGKGDDYNLRSIQQINFVANLERTGNTRMFLIIEELKETIHKEL